MMKYIWMFCGIYMLTLIVLITLSVITGIKSPTAVTLGTLAAASVFALDKFIKNEKRYFSKEEREKLLTGSILFHLLIYGTLTVIAPSESVHAMSYKIFSILLMGLLHGIFLFIIYGPAGKKRAEKFLEKT